MRKKLLLAAITVTMGLSVAACSKESTDSKDNKKAVSKTEESDKKNTPETDDSKKETEETDKSDKQETSVPEDVDLEGAWLYSLDYGTASKELTYEGLFVNQNYNPEYIKNYIINNDAMLQFTYSHEDVCTDCKYSELQDSWTIEPGSLYKEITLGEDFPVIYPFNMSDTTCTIKDAIDNGWFFYNIGDLEDFNSVSGMTLDAGNNDIYGLDAKNELLKKFGAFDSLMVKKADSEKLEAYISKCELEPNNMDWKVVFHRTIWQVEDYILLIFMTDNLTTGMSQITDFSVAPAAILDNLKCTKGTNYDNHIIEGDTIVSFDTLKSYK